MLQSQSIIYDQDSKTGLFERRKDQIEYSHIKRMPFIHLFDERKIKIINKTPGWISLSFIGKNWEGKSTSVIVAQEIKSYPNYFAGKVSESTEKRSKTYPCVIYQKNTGLVMYYFQRLSKAEMGNELAEYYVSSFTEPNKIK